jgi:putative addiction module killer protein
MKLVVKLRTAKVVQDEAGRCPFEQYLGRLKDVVGKAKILARIERAQKGNFGDHKHLVEGLFEMREDYGPGYRIYFGVEGDEIILLLLAGTKRHQNRDIEQARELLLDHRKKGKKS